LERAVISGQEMRLSPCASAMRAWFRALKYYKENPEEASGIIAKYYRKCKLWQHIMDKTHRRYMPGCSIVVHETKAYLRGH